LYLHVKRTLIDEIERGDYLPDVPFVSERKVRERFGVSTTTAVRALNELVAEGVLVRRQGSGTYVADRSSAQATAPADDRLTTTSPGTIAVILQRQGPHVAHLLNGLATRCDELGYQLLLTHCDDDGEREDTALRRAIASRVGGIVLYPADSGARPRTFAEVQKQGVPMVLVDRYRPDVATDAVLADNVAVGYQVTQELIRQGHRRIATLWGETECTSIRDRLTGHVQALRENGLTVRSDLTVLRRYVEPATLHRNRQVVESLLEAPDPPTVFLCANGYALAAAAEDLVALGVEVPGDIDLAGMDDAGPFDILPLTTVAATLPSTEMGRQAADLLHARITSGRPPGNTQHLILPIGIRTRNASPGHLRLVATA